MFQDIRTIVDLQLVNLFYYAYEEVYARDNHFEDLYHFLCHIDETQCRVLGELFCNYTFQHAADLMAVCFSTPVNLADVTYIPALSNADSE